MAVGVWRAEAVHPLRIILFGSLWQNNRNLKGLFGKVREAVILTRYAFETRYPGPFEPVTEEEYREAVRLAEAVVTWADRVMTGGSYNASGPD